VKVAVGQMPLWLTTMKIHIKTWKEDNSQNGQAEMEQSGDEHLNL